MLNPYNLLPNDKGYHFYTDGNLSYFIYFDQGTIYFSQTPGLNKLTYTFGFDCTHDADNHAFDCRIEDTIITTFRSFFDINPTAILSYVCDAQDSYELLRFRLFNLWYHRHLASTCEKLEIKIPELKIYGAIIFKQDNPISPFIKEAFFKEFD